MCIIESGQNFDSKNISKSMKYRQIEISIVKTSKKESLLLLK